MKNVSLLLRCSSFLMLFLSNSPASAQEKLVVGSLGDSITVACNASRIGDNPEYSWATGTADGVFSHMKRLAILTKTNVQGVNLAVTGAKAADLAQQIEKLAAYNPDYVTIEVGANDLCSWTESYEARILEYTATMRTNISKILEIAPNSKILLATIPNVYGLWEVGKSRIDCQMKWDLFNICSPLLHSSRSQDERIDFRDRWNAVNSMLMGLTEEYPDRIIFNKAVGEAVFGFEHMSSIDCFHPSVMGQDLLSDRAWPYMRSLAN